MRYVCEQDVCGSETEPPLVRGYTLWKGFRGASAIGYLPALWVRWNPFRLYQMHDYFGYPELTTVLNDFREWAGPH